MTPHWIRFLMKVFERIDFRLDWIGLAARWWILQNKSDSWTLQDQFSEGGIGFEYVRDLHSDAIPWSWPEALCTLEPSSMSDPVSSQGTHSAEGVLPKQSASAAAWFYFFINYLDKLFILPLYSAQQSRHVSHRFLFTYSGWITHFFTYRHLNGVISFLTIGFIPTCLCVHRHSEWCGRVHIPCLKIHTGRL